MTLEGISELVCPVDRMRILLDVSDGLALIGEGDLWYVRVLIFVVQGAVCDDCLLTATHSATDSPDLIKQSHNISVLWCNTSTMQIMHTYLPNHI